MSRVSEQRWREAQQHEREFWEHWRDLPAYRGLALDRYWAGELKQFAVPENFFSGKRVLDLGCGPVGMIHFVSGAELRVRLDPLLNQYKGLLPLPPPQLSLTAAGEALPLANSTIDVCICFNALDHMREPETAVAEMHRVLRPGGTLLVMVHDFPAWALPLLWPDRLHPHHWTHAVAKNLLSARFEVVHAHRAQRHFMMPWRELLKPSGWKYLAGNIILHTSYFTARKV